MAERLRFHTDSRVNNEWGTTYYGRYLDYVSRIISDEVKRERFKNFLNNPPIPTVEVTEKIWRKRDRIFNAEDKYEKLEFKDREDEDNAIEYLVDTQFDEWFDDELNEYRKTSPNSFWVVDYPTFERDEEGNVKNVPNQTEPYPFIVDIDYVIDYVDTRKGLEYVIYTDKVNEENYKDGKIVCIDGVNFTIIPLDEDGTPGYNNAVIVPHSGKKTPAGQLSNQPLLKQDYQIKTNIVVNQLSALDSYLFAKISKKYLDSYMFPIIEKLAEVCDYTDHDGTECEGGVLTKYYYQGSYVDANSEYCKDSGVKKITIDCPTCAEKKLIGAGTVFEKPVPDSENGDVGDAVKFVTPQVDYLTYSKETIFEFETMIISNSVGTILQNEQSVNEMQIQAGLESRKDILLDEAKEMSGLKAEIIDCIMQGRYGDDYLKSIIDLGTEYYLINVKDLEERKLALIEKGASQSELMQLQEKIISSEYRNNPEIKERLLMLLQLEPFPLISIDKAFELSQQGRISEQNLEKKINFDNLVRRFEREQGNILEFMPNSEYSTRIEIIENNIDKYLQDGRENILREQGREQNIEVDGETTKFSGSEVVEDGSD